MRINRKSIGVGLVVGALAGGAGGALAASGSSTTTTPASPYGAGQGYMGGGYMGGGYMGGGPGHMARGSIGAMRGAALGRGAPFTAAAGYLGLSETQLQTQLQSGKTLAQVANAQGKSVSGLESAMTAAIKQNLDANTTLSATQKASILAQFKDRLDTFVNTTCPRAGGAGPADGLRPGYGPMMRG